MQPWGGTSSPPTGTQLVEHIESRIPRQCAAATAAMPVNFTRVKIGYKSSRVEAQIGSLPEPRRCKLCRVPKGRYRRGSAVVHLSRASAAYEVPHRYMRIA